MAVNFATPIRFESVFHTDWVPTSSDSVFVSCEWCRILAYRASELPNYRTTEALTEPKPGSIQNCWHYRRNDVSWGSSLWETYICFGAFSKQTLCPRRAIPFFLRMVSDPYLPSYRSLELPNYRSTYRIQVRIHLELLALQEQICFLRAAHFATPILF